MQFVQTETIEVEAAPAGSRAYLSGSGILRRPLQGTVLRIGRGPGNEISPQGVGLSARHAELRRTESGWEVVDLGSRNGTFVAGARVTRALLPVRAELRFGGVVMWFEQDDGYGERGVEALDGLIGRHSTMLELARMVRRVAPSPVAVLIEGETGVGKERVAENLHRLSGRRGAFVPINCGAFSPELVGAELFGALRGAYTGADRDRVGAFGAAHGGTLFLDEVGELPQSVQVQLLRALESGSIRRLGEARERPVDVRILAATHRPLRAMVASGDFRADLFHRLAVFPIAVPPLRERRSDVPAIAEHLLAVADPSKRFDRDALAAMRAADWPGNVRELRNVILRAAILAQGDLISAHSLALSVPRVSAGPSVITDEPLRLALGICAAQGNLSDAARQLGCSRSTLYRRLKKVGWSELDKDELLAMAQSLTGG